MTIHNTDYELDPDEGIDHSYMYSIELLNSLVLSKLTLAHLKPKQGCPLMFFLEL